MKQDQDAIEFQKKRHQNLENEINIISKKWVFNAQKRFISVLNWIYPRR